MTTQADIRLSFSYQPRNARGTGDSVSRIYAKASTLIDAAVATGGVGRAWQVVPEGELEIQARICMLDWLLDNHPLIFLNIPKGPWYSPRPKATPKTKEVTLKIRIEAERWEAIKATLAPTERNDIITEALWEKAQKRLSKK